MRQQMDFYGSREMSEAEIGRGTLAKRSWICNVHIGVVIAVCRAGTCWNHQSRDSREQALSGKEHHQCWKPEASTGQS